MGGNSPGFVEKLSTNAKILLFFFQIGIFYKTYCDNLAHYLVHLACKARQIVFVSMTEVTTLGGGMDAHNKPGIQTKTDAKRERGDNVERPCDGCPH